MNVRLVALLLVAVIAAGGAVFAASSWISAKREEIANLQNKPAPKIEAIQVLVASQTLPTGTLLNKDLFRWQNWPNKEVAPSYLRRKDTNLDDLVGAVVRNAVTNGEPITLAKIVHPGERGFLAAVLKPEHRAITVPVNAVTGIAGFVFPGDRVDLLLTHTIKQEKKNRHATETVLADVRVLAIDQSTNDQADQPQLSKNVTLEVTPKQAEMVTLISAIGKLSLSLRSLQQEEQPTPIDPNMTPEALLASLTTKSEEKKTDERKRGHTWDTEVSPLLYTPNVKNSTTPVKVVRGGASQIIRFPKGSGGNQEETVIDLTPRSAAETMPTLALPAGTLPGIAAGTDSSIGAGVN